MFKWFKDNTKIEKSKIENDTDIVVDFIRSILPVGMTSRKVVNPDNEYQVLMSTNTESFIFSYSLDGHIDELGDDEKDYIIKTCIIPTLEQMDKDLHERHLEILDVLKDLKARKDK